VVFLQQQLGSTAQPFEIANLSWPESTVAKKDASVTPALVSAVSFERAHRRRGTKEIRLIDLESAFSPWESTGSFFPK